MKKLICSFFICISVSVTYAQNESNYAPQEGGGGPVCNCTAPSNSTCSADCTFSSCCICWNPSIQTGGCGCYYGIAACRNQNNASNSLMNSSNFGEISPDARITFSFEKFSLLFDYFKSKGISPDIMENVFGSVKSNYSLNGKKIGIANYDFAKILSEYSKLIDRLDTRQKEDLNIFIKSLK